MTSVDLIPTNSSPEADAGMPAALDLASAARVLDLEDWIVGRLRHPISETRFNMQILRDSGEPFTCPVLHVEHNTTLGRGCGAIDFAADAFVGSLVGRAMHSTWQ